MKNSLDKKGLSMSEAQSISNIAFQKASDIASQLANINNFSKTVTVEGKSYDIVSPNPIPSNIKELIASKAKYHATQAFLMENIKAKESLINSIKNEQFVYPIEAPTMDKLETGNFLPEVDDKWGMAQLSLDEVNDFLLREAEAAHIGQFIHNRSVLDSLRRELSNIPNLEWMEVETGKKTPVVINTHHTSEQLSALYEEFSAMHREAEQKVNFYKAKIKNLVTSENARIAALNAVETTRVSTINAERREAALNAQKKWREEYAAAEFSFEEARKLRIQEASALKIKTAPQFQETVDEILKTLKREE